jgi:hypothetical protein
LARETLDDAWMLCNRLYKRDCPITKSKLNKLFRDGGRIETMIPIYVSKGVLETAKDINVKEPLDELKKCLNKGDKFWSATTRLPRWIGKHWLGANPVWEHVVEVETAWKAGVKLVMDGASSGDFDEWFVRECRENWKICIVTRKEDERLWKATDPNGNKLKGKDRYDKIEQPLDAQYLLRSAII